MTQYLFSWKAFIALLGNVVSSHLTTAQDPSLEDEVGLGHVNADVHHLVVAALEASSHLVDGDDEAAEQRLEQLAHGLLRLAVAALNHHHHGFIDQLMVEMRDFKILEASKKKVYCLTFTDKYLTI